MLVSGSVAQTEWAKINFGNLLRPATPYASMVPAVSRPSEPLARNGRFDLHDRVVDVLIALEGMYDVTLQGERLAARVHKLACPDSAVGEERQNRITYICARR